MPASVSMSRACRVLLAVISSWAVLGCGRSPFDLEDELVQLDEAVELNDPVTGGCRKVDYLFVIDNSASMGDNQSKLVDSFDVFIDGVERSQDTLESIHVGVVSTDGYAGNEGSCTGFGGLITTTTGHNSSQAQCGPYAEGHNYMTEADDLRETFTCAAQVGTTGSNAEHPIDALVAAVGDEMSGPGECNEGFIRDDALLVAVIVTDEDDAASGRYRFEQLVEAKGGRADNIVMVGLINEPGTACSLSGHAREAPNLYGFIGSFLHSFVAPVCGDYGVAFEQALAVVEAACWDA